VTVSINARSLGNQGDRELRSPETPDLVDMSRKAILSPGSTSVIVTSRARPDRWSSGVQVATRPRFVGQRKLSLTADTYTHVLSDGRELDYTGVLR
jgi:hypothetical protein